jgi:hypothetical protein
MSEARSNVKTSLEGMELRVNDLRDKLKRHATKVATVRPLAAIDTIVVHTTDWDTSIERLVDYDIGPNHISTSGCPTITYHDVIMKDGTLNHCEYYRNTTWHAGKYNRDSVAIAMMYKCSNPGKVDFDPTKEQMSTLDTTLVSMCLALKVLPQGIKGHRECEGTGFIWVVDKDNGKARQSLLKTCPGMGVDLYALRKRITTRLQTKLKIDGFYTGLIDGDFGPKSKEALLAWRPK